MRLKTKIWLQAGLRRCFAEGRAAVVLRHGDDDAGAVLLKINRGRDRGCDVLTQARTGDGDPAWLALNGNSPLDEAAADRMIDEQVRYDPDLWVVEIEDRDGAIPFEGERIV